MNPQSRIILPTGPMASNAVVLTFTLFLLILLTMTVSGFASAAIVLTSTTGNVSAEGKTLAQDDVLSTGDRIDLDANATASLMVGDSAIVRLCHGASLSFPSDPSGVSGALNLSTGQLKVSTSTRAGDDPLEIHTPAAIATLLGTEGHIEVDPVTGDTVVTSLHHEIRVNGLKGSADQSVVVAAGQKVAIRTGFGPGAVEAADVSSALQSSACLDDAGYRIAAVADARRKFGQDSVGPIALMDEVDDVPTVAAGPPIIPTGMLGAPLVPVPKCATPAQCGVSAQSVFLPGLPIPPNPPGYGAPQGFLPNAPGPAPPGPAHRLYRQVPRHWRSAVSAAARLRSPPGPAGRVAEAGSRPRCPGSRPVRSG